MRQEIIKGEVIRTDAEGNRTMRHPVGKPITFPLHLGAENKADPEAHMHKGEKKGQARSYLDEVKQNYKGPNRTEKKGRMGARGRKRTDAK